MATILDVNDSNFESEVLQSQVPVVVKFYLSWSGPCRVLDYTVSKMANSYEGSVKFVKLDIEKNLYVSDRYRIMSVPALMKFENGERIARTREHAPITEVSIVADLNLYS